MTQKQRLLTVLMTLMLSVTGAWALDGSGTNSDPYQLGSLQDWKDFAAIVNGGTPNIDAKMIADIDLGTDQTMIGSSTYPYGGVFDGQGHTLTVHLISTTEANIAPFRSISNSTIKNLAVAGSVTGLLHSSGLVSGMPADNTVNNFISNVMVSVTITTTASHCGGILGHGGNATTTIQDCLFNGTINGKEGGSTVAAICGWTEGITNIISCLENGTYTNCSSFEPIYASLYGEYHGSYNYYVNGSSTRGTQATTTTLSDGIVTTGLNGSRTGDDVVWVQQGSQPILKTFAVKTDASGAYLIGSVGDWIGFSNIVATTQNANAKMTADINLGDDQTVIGGVYNGSTLFYQGTFDGQGHTLTIAYNNTSGERFTTPFSLLEGATIKNLHLDGTVNSTYAYGGSIASILKGTNTIENVWNSVTAVCTMGGWVQMGGFIGVLESSATATISDCLYTGSITHNGGYSGYFNGGYGPKPTVNNCLVLGAFTGEFGFNGNYDNCYCKHASTTGVTQPSDTNLSDGTTTTALNNGRTGDDAVWVQQGSQPMLKTFAVETDESGTYLIGSVDDWKAFADIVNSGTNPAANAKMIADINLGTDQTRIGSTSDSNTALHYQGVFDGQGHKLTVAYVETGNSNLCAPFTKLNNATIKNLHIAGTIQTAGIHGAGIASDSRGTTTIENIWVEASISSTHTGWDEESAFVGCMKAGTLNITDCVFTGTVTGTGSYNGCFVGYIDSGSATFTNCLSTGTFTGSFDFRGTHNNCYVKQFTTAIPTDMQVTDAELADGTTTTALNAGRVNGPWVQDAVSGEPRLDLFMATTSVTAHEGSTGEYWATYYNGVKSFVADANTTVYQASVNSGKTGVVLTEVTGREIPAGKGVVLKSTSTTIMLTPATTTQALDGNELQGSDVDLATPTNAYCLSKETTRDGGLTPRGVGFYTYTLATIPAHRAYLVVEGGPNPTRGFLGFGDDDNTTGISLPEAVIVEADGPIYDLSGRRVTGQPHKGIYVKDGKKFVIK